MAYTVDHGGLAPDKDAAKLWVTPSADALRAAGPALLYALRLWASVCLALYVAFWLELDNSFWAGTSAAIVCQPQLGASLRKGWFRMIGTVIGAITIVVLTACFPQDRIAFLAGLALWVGICAFTATVLRNFASYSAALAGYTAAIVAADTLGATGGPSASVFMLAIWRASEIGIGIVCAGIVLAGTDLGGARRRLAASFADLAAGIADGFTRMLALAGPQLPETQSQRREFVRRVIALEPVVDQALGESSDIRYHSPTLQMAIRGLFVALAGWRGVATHLERLPEATSRQRAEAILLCIPPELRSAHEPSVPTRWTTEPAALRRVGQKAVRALLALHVDTPSMRLLADEAAKMLGGILRVLDGLALLVDDPDRTLPADRAFQLGTPDLLPAFINAVRAFLTIGAVALFWVATAWPNGASAIVFAAIVVLLLSPRGDLAYGGALAFALGTGAAVLCAATIKFAVLPALDTFPGFCAAIGLFFVPAGFALAQSRHPAAIAVFSAFAFNFVPLLAPTNPMSYDTAQFYNSALAIVVGCGVAPLAFRVLPPLSPARRTRRLLAFTLRDLRRLSLDRASITSDDWRRCIYSRLAALPDAARPIHRSRLMAALSVGSQILDLRRVGRQLGVSSQLQSALTAFAQGNGSAASTRLAALDDHLSSIADAHPPVLRARSQILALREALDEHPLFFDAGAFH
jgi:uncharacterized membrane protein YccC